MSRALPFLLLAGCQASFHSEQGQWSFQDPDLAAEANTGFGDDMGLLAGTEVCPIPSWVAGDVEGWSMDDLFAACVEQGIGEGGSFTAEGCLLLEEPGEVAWTLEPVACEAPFPAGGEPVPDQVVFQVVDPAAAVAHLDPWAEDFALETLDLTPPGLTEEDLLPPEGEPWRLLEGAGVLLYAQLLADGRPVGWRGADGEVLLEGDGERIGEGDLPAGWIGLRLAAGDEAAISLRVGEDTWPVGAVRGVAAADLASLTLVAAFVPTEEGGEIRSPWAARAILRDGDGEPVFGAPVEWSVANGRLAVEPGPGENTLLPGADYAWVTDACEPPARTVGERRATLEARYGDLSDHLDLTWTITEEMVDLDTEDWGPSEHCTGCGCGHAGTRGSGALLLGLAGLAARRRSRPDPWDQRRGGALHVSVGTNPATQRPRAA